MEFNLDRDFPHLCTRLAAALLKEDNPIQITTLMRFSLEPLNGRFSVIIIKYISFELFMPMQTKGCSKTLSCFQIL